MDFNQELIEALEAGNKIIADLKTRLDSIEAKDAKAHRPHMGGEGFANDPDSKAEMKAFGNFMRSGDKSEMKSLSTGSGPDGGFSVPKVIDGIVAELVVNISPIRQIAAVQPISTQDFHKIVDVRGTTSAWVGETATRPATNTPQLEDICPPMGELYAFPQATQVMLDDAQFNAEQWLADSVATEFARAEGAAFVAGTGITQPRGFTTYPTAATGDATRAFGTLEHYPTGTSGAFKTLTSTVNPVDDFFALISRLKAGYRKNAVFVMNKTTLFFVMGIKDCQGRYVFNPSPAPGLPDTILGYPVYEAEDMPTYTTANALAIAFGDFSRGYLVVDRIGTRILRDPFSNRPYVGFYCVRRTGGSCVITEAIKFLKFSTT